MNINTVNHCVTVNASLHRCFVQCYPRDVQDATERCCVVCVPVRRYTVDIYTVSTQYLYRVDIYTAPRGYLRPRTGSCGGNDGPRARAVTTLCQHNNLHSHTFPPLWVIVSKDTWICGQVSQSQVETTCRNDGLRARVVTTLRRHNYHQSHTFPPSLGHS